ncbi:MAG: flagellar biosynthesis protein FlhF [Planctomycetota bacterium]|nr:flagellar biosynthesis protein FlhF [Planctomycetota bacterium]
MKLRTFMAASMSEALALVKAQLGPRAMILHTRTYKRGGLMGLGGKTVVEITAAEGDAVPQAAPRRAEPAKVPQRRLDADQNAGDLIRRTYAVAKAELSRQQGNSGATNNDAAALIASISAGPPASTKTSASAAAAAFTAGAVVPAWSPTPPAAAAPVSPVARAAAPEQLAQEMREVHRLVARLARQQGGGAVNAADCPGPLFDHYLAMLRNEVADELAESVVAQVKQKLSPEKLQDAAAVRSALLEALAKHVPTDQALGAPTAVNDGRPRTIALVGPTGVGKTTTIAKLAATFKLRQKLTVGLVTIDTYRIAAVEQLRTYANIIGVPLQIAMTPREIADAMAFYSSGPNRVDVVLIDTAGRSQRDDPRLEQLRAFIDAAQPHEVHLVLSSTCSQPVLLETVERFAAVRTERIIFTKLDEAVSFGVVVNVVSKVNKRLSYVTTGQEVPHQIEPGRADRLAELVLGSGD